MSRGPNQPDAPALHSIRNSLKHNTIIHCPSIFDQNSPEWVDMAHYAVGAVKVRPLRSRRGEAQYEMARFVLRKRLNRAAIALATGKGSKMGYFVLRTR